MGSEDLEFARGSVRYLRRAGLRPREIAEALVREIGCTSRIAERLATAA